MPGERFEVHINLGLGPEWVLVDTSTGEPVAYYTSPLMAGDDALIRNGKEAQKESS